MLGAGLGLGVWVGAAALAALIPAITVTPEGQLQQVSAGRVFLANQVGTRGWNLAGPAAAWLIMYTLRSRWPAWRVIATNLLIGSLACAAVRLTVPAEPTGVAGAQALQAAPLPNELRVFDDSLRVRTINPIVVPTGRRVLRGAIPVTIGSNRNIVATYLVLVLLVALVETWRRRSALQLQLSTARLDALRMQLQPHFLFNTLNTVSGLIDPSPETAKQVIARLGALLRETQRVTTPTVPLTRELAWLDDYVELQQARFGDRLRVDIAVEPESLDVQVPFLILQPLVENAIQHGLERRAGDSAGQIEILSEIVGGKLRLKVRDNGAGLGDDAVRPGALGLANVRARLAEQYGGEASLQVKAMDGGGTEVVVEVPLRAK